LLREHLLTGRIDIKAFYTRRILRIWPLYFAFIALAVLLERFMPEWWIPRDCLLAFLLLSGNWYFVRNGWIGGPTPPLWSISIEEQFYLFIPLLMRSAGKRAVLLLSAAILPVSYVAIWILGSHNASRDFAVWPNSFVQFQFFAAGTLTAFFLSGGVPAWPLWRRMLTMISGMAAWVAASAVFHVHDVHRHTHYLPGPECMGYVLILAGVLSLFFSILGLPSKYIPKPMMYLGKISYGLYVFHMLTLLLTGSDSRLRSLMPHISWPVWGLLALTMTVACAHLSYRYFETPFLLLKRKFSRVDRPPQAEEVTSELRKAV
jgi:peptidoglycan/LPS O-acetylase OafA/YrhL